MVATQPSNFRSVDDNHVRPPPFTAIGNYACLTMTVAPALTTIPRTSDDDGDAMTGTAMQQRGPQRQDENDCIYFI